MLRNTKFYKILIAILSAILIYSIVNLVLSEKDRNKKIVEIGTKKVGLAKAELEIAVRNIEENAAIFTKEIAKNSTTEKELQALLKDELLHHSAVISITVGYEPYKYDKSIRLFSSIYHRNSNFLVEESSDVDYTDRTLETNNWYTNAIDGGGSGWTDPYYSNSLNQLVVDYYIPFKFKGDKSESSYSGVVSFTISLIDASNAVSKLGLGFSGYAFIITRDNKILAHPKTEFLTDTNLVTKYIESEPNFLRLKTEDSGFFTVKSPYTFEQSILFFASIENTDWVLGLVLIDEDLVPNYDTGIRRLVNIVLLSTLIIVFILVLFLKVYEGDNKKMWYFSIIISLLFFINIAFVWYVNVVMVDQREDLHKQEIITKTDLANYLAERNSQLKLIGYPNSIEIPTGIFIYDIDFNNAYTISIQGKVWQRIPDSIQTNDEQYFVFPQKLSKGISVRTQLVSKTKVDNTWLYRYNFKATLDIDFFYTKFPLDFRMLNIQLMHPDIHKNMILVPDLYGYTKMNPGSKPGISDDIYLPGERISSTFFSFASINYNSNLGNVAYNGPTSAPILEFNILVKRNLANVLIGNILPILVIAVMLFLMTFTLHKVGGELIEGSALTVIQAAGGFIFILLLAHIQLRNSLITPDITYLETFYFIMYAFVSVVSTAILLYVKTDRFEFLEYKSNIIVKIAFWPVLFITTYIVTIFMVY